jgi:insulysin
MLFMGSTKYPGENDYSEYITNNGGYDNAFTDYCYTNYHFECANNAFAGALDRFAQFFICPLLSESGTEREMKAVDSEFQMEKQSDAWLYYAVLADLSNKQSKLHRFATGSLETLKQDGIREALLDFHKTWYSSNIMTLVLTSNSTIAESEKLVNELFTTIENKNVVIPPLSGPVMPFNCDNLG